MKRKPIHVSPDLATKVGALAKKRDWSVGEAADHLIKVGFTRVETLKRFAAKRPKRAKGK